MTQQSTNEQISIRNMDIKQYNEIKKHYVPEDNTDNEQSIGNFKAEKGSVKITGYENGTVLFQGIGALKECSMWKRRFENTSAMDNLEFSGYLSLIIDVIFGKERSFDEPKKQKILPVNFWNHSYIKFIVSLFLYTLLMLVFIIFAGIISKCLTSFNFTNDSDELIKGILIAVIPIYISFIISEFQRKEQERKSNNEKMGLINNLSSELRITQNALVICENYIEGIEKIVKDQIQEEEKVENQNQEKDKVEDQNQKKEKIKEYISDEYDKVLIQTIINRINLSILDKIIKHEKMTDRFITDIQNIYYSIEELKSWYDKVDALEFKHMANKIGGEIEKALEAIDNYTKVFR